MVRFIIMSVTTFFIVGYPIFLVAASKEPTLTKKQIAEVFVNKVDPKAINGQSDIYKEALVEALKNLSSAEEMEDVIYLSMRYVSKERVLVALDNWRDNVAIVSAIASIPRSDREDTLDLSEHLFMSPMNLRGKIHIIKATAAIPRDDREAVVELSGNFVTQDMYGHDGADIMNAIKSIPQKERSERVERTLKEINKILGENHGKQVGIHVLKAMILKFLKTPIPAPRPQPLPSKPAAAAAVQAAPVQSPPIRPIPALKPQPLPFKPAATAAAATTQAAPVQSEPGKLNVKELGRRMGLEALLAGGNPLVPGAAQKKNPPQRDTDEDEKPLSVKERMKQFSK